ncbi:hypothetical protein SLA2020_367330 [Shorea laevis]
MCCSRLVFFFCFILLHSVTLTFALQDPYVCSESGNYTSNSTYRANLNSLLASMSSNTEIDYGFYNLSTGENSTDKVHMIALCRGDIFPDECRSCVHNPLLAYYNIQNVSDVEGFNQVLRPLLDRLRNRAASGNSTRKFAVGSAAAPDSQTIRALLMCTPDLDELECNNCLGRAAEYIPQCCNGKQGGRYIAPSCDLRYEIYSFYDPAAETSSEGKESNSSQTVVIITVPTVASVLLIICIYIYIFYLRVSKPRENDETILDEMSSAETLQFEFSLIKVATENFSIANKLGEGGFGAVYKGNFQMDKK